MLGAILIATFVAAYQSNVRETEDANVRFTERASGTAQVLNDRIGRIEQRLRGAVGVVAAVGSAPLASGSSAWNTYFDAIRDSENDGLLSISYLPKGATTLLALEGRQVRHLTQAPPEAARSPERVAEIIRALESPDAANGPTVSRLIARADDATQSSGLVALMLPVRSATRTDAGKTETNVSGWVVGLVSLADFVAQASGTQNQFLSIALQADDRLMFTSPAFSQTREGAKFRATESVRVGQAIWQLQVVGTRELEKQFSSRTPKVIFSIGMLGTLLMAALIWLLTRVRQQAETLAQSMTVQLRDQVNFTEALIEFNPNPIFRKNAAGEYVAVNRAWELLTGRHRDDILGKASHEFLPSISAGEDARQDQTLMAAASGSAVAEVVIDNRGRHFETMVAKQVLRDSQGQFDGLIGTITDVTEIKALERELDRQREQLNMVISSSQQGIYDLVFDGSQEPYFSARFQEILGFNAVSFPRSFQWKDAIHPDDFATFYAEAIRHFKRKTALFDIEIRARRRDDSFVWVRVRAIAQFNANNRATRFVGSIVDIADRKEAEATLVEANVRVTEAARAKEAFLATMSHEIRTPLNGVLGMAGLLAETRLNDEQRDYIRLIRASGDTLLRLIDDVLDFSKIESGRMPLESIAIEIIPLVEEVFDLVGDRAREKRLVLSYDARDDLPFYVMGDATRIRQILLNLVSNAIKFTKAGGVHITLRARRIADGKLELTGAVNDTGIGISAENLSHLFQPFTQADASTTRKYGGTGLGLVIVKRLAEMMGGDVKAESVEGEGSTFTFTILTQPARGPLKPYMQRDVFDFVGKRLLVVESSRERRERQEFRLIRWGLSTTIVEPENAVAALAAITFDIVLTDFAVETEEARAFQAALLAHDAARQLQGQRPMVSILSSHLSRAELAQRGVATPVRHDLLVFRPVTQARLFDVMMRASLGEFGGDDVFRPFDLLADLTPAQRISITGVQQAITGVQQAVTGVQATITGSQYTISSSAGSSGGAARAGAFESALQILVAEDNEINQRVIRGMLSNLGHHITLVGDGRAAVDAAEAARFDVILMDIHMPILDGLAAMHEIRQVLGPACPPIAAMTAHAMPGDREGYLNAGMSDYVAKPLRMAELSNLFVRLADKMEFAKSEAKTAKASEASTVAAAQAAREAEIAAAMPPPAPALATPTAPAKPLDLRTMPVLDLEQLEDLRYLPPSPEGDDPVMGLITLFRAKANERMAIIEDCLGCADWKRLSDTAHSLRGAAASMGFPRVAAICKSLELGGRRLLPNDPKLALLGLDNIAPPTQQELDELYEQMGLHYREADIAMSAWLATPVTDVKAT